MEAHHQQQQQREQYWSKPTEHGNRPPSGSWTFKNGTKNGEIQLTVTASDGAKGKITKKDIDGTAGRRIETRFVDGRAIVPKHFRWKNGAVHYDPALDDADTPMLVMCLKHVYDVAWDEGVDEDVDIDAELPADPGSKFLVRKVTTMIPKGTVGVVVAKVSQDEAVVNWSVCQTSYFPPLKGKGPHDTIMNRLKVKVKLSNLMQVGPKWRKARDDINMLEKEKRGSLAVGDLKLTFLNEPSEEERTPFCYRDEAIKIELAELSRASCE